MAIVATGEMAVTPDLKGFESKMTSSLGGIAKKAALAFGGAFAATKAVDFLTSSVADAREANKVAAQTAAAIKSTGSAANVTAKQVDQLANSISRKTGIDDEQIAKASNLLLTFTNVRNVAGENNDIFNQATKIATDMGAALGTDAAGSAIQLGKALNDPIKGISALTRVGVTFSDAQKKQIAAFVETGDVASAQKVILAELTKEFGGSAAAQATAADRLKVTFGNLKEDLGNKLIPVLDKLAVFLADKLPGALDAAGKAFAFLNQVFQTIKPTLITVFEVLSRVFKFVMDNKEILVGVAVAIAAGLVPAFIAWASAATAAAVATIAAAAPVIAIGVAIGALVAGLIYAYNHWTGFREVVQSVASFITEGLVPAFGKIIEVVGKVINWVRDHWPLLFAILGGPIGLAAVAIIKNFDKIKAVGEAVFGAITGAVQGFINIVKSAWEWVKRLLDKIASIKFPKIPGQGVVGNVLGKIPGFAEGGTVPGRIGQPTLAVVHGGEKVTPVGGDTSGQMFRDLIIQGATFEGADRNAASVVRELRAEAYRQGR